MWTRRTHAYQRLKEGGHGCLRRPVRLFPSESRPTPCAAGRWGGTPGAKTGEQSFRKPLQASSRWCWWLDELEPALLRRTSTGSHQHATGAAGQLTMTIYQRGLFDAMLVDEGGHCCVTACSCQNQCDAPGTFCRTTVNVHPSTASGHPLSSRL